MIKRTYKKALSLFLALVMISSLFPTAMAAPGTAEVSVGNATVNAGESFVVPVNIANNPGITNFDLQVTYDTNALTLDKFSVMAPQGVTNNGICATGTLNGNINNGIAGWIFGETITANGALYFLKFTAKSSAVAGDYQIKIGLMQNGVFTDAPGDTVIHRPVNFTPGTITVNAAPSTDCTVNFIDGATTITKTVAKGSVMTDLPAEPVKANHIFAGWYAGTVTGATDYIVTGNSFTGTEFRPKYDTVAASADYHAVWIGEASTAALVKTGNNAVIKESYALIQTAINGSTVATTVKMLTDCTQTLTIPEGKTITLDMNGHNLASATNIGINVPGGTLSVENSSSKPSAISATGFSFGIDTEGSVAASIPYLRDIQTKNCSNGIRLWPGKIDLIENCEITATSYGIVLQANFGTTPATPSTILDIKNTKITATGGSPIEVNPSCTVHITSALLNPKATWAPIKGSAELATFAPGKTLSSTADAQGFYSLVDGYTVAFYNAAKDDCLEIDYVPAGSFASYNGEAPFKISSATEHFTFTGWKNMTGDAVVDPATNTANVALYPYFTPVTRTSAAQIGATNYATIQAAVDAAAANATIKVLDDLYEDVNVPAGKTLTIDLNGHLLRNTSGLKAAITNAGTLTVTSSAAQHGGILYRAYQDASYRSKKAGIDNKGTLTLSKLDFSGNEMDCAVNNDGSASLISMTECKVTDSKTGIQFIDSAHAGTIDNVTMVCSGNCIEFLAQNGNTYIDTIKNCNLRMTGGEDAVIWMKVETGAVKAYINTISDTTITSEGMYYGIAMQANPINSSTEIGNLHNVTINAPDSDGISVPFEDNGSAFVKGITGNTKITGYMGYAIDNKYITVTGVEGGKFKGTTVPFAVPDTIGYAPGMSLSTTTDGEGYYSVVGSGNTLTFNNGTTTETIKVTGDKMTKLPAEPTKTGYIFAGWYATGVTEVNADYTTTGNSFTGTEFRPKYDTVTASANYRAVWIPAADTAGIIRTAANVATIYDTPDLLFRGITAASQNVTVKMFSDYIGKELAIPAGAIVTLDMNGHKIDEGTGMGVDSPMLTNNGTLSIENSAAGEALIHRSNKVALTNNGTMPIARDITIRSDSFRAVHSEGTTVLSAVVEAPLAVNFWSGSLTIAGGYYKSTGAGEPPVALDLGYDQYVQFPEGKVMAPITTGQYAGYYGLTDGFTVRFYGEDNTTLMDVDYCPATQTASYKDGQNPTKLGTGSTEYVFAGWVDKTTNAPVDLSTLKTNAALCATFTTITASQAKVGNTEYATIQLAANAIAAQADKTDTITLLRNCNAYIGDGYGNTILNVAEGCNITMDMGGYTITMLANDNKKGPWDAKPIENYGTLLLKNGTITKAKEGALGSDIMLSNNRGAALTLLDFDCNAFAVCIENNAGATISNITNSNLQGAYYGINSSGSGPVDGLDTSTNSSKIIRITSGTVRGYSSALKCSGTYIGEIAGGTFGPSISGALQGGDYGAELWECKVGTISGGTFASRQTGSEHNGLYLKGCSVATISGGEFAGYLGGLCIDGGAVANISDGKFASTIYYGIHMKGGGHIGTISGGNFTGEHGVYISNNPSAKGISTITGGTFNGTNSGIYHCGAEDMKITGGTFVGKTSGGIQMETPGTTKCNISGTAKVDGCTRTSGTISISGGFVKGTIGSCLTSGKIKGANADKDGYYPVETYTKAEPVIDSGAAVVTVPDVALEVERNHLDAKTTQNTTKTEVTLGTAIVGSMDKAGSLEISTDTASVQFNDAALKVVKTAAATETVKLTVTKKEKADLTPAQQVAAAYAGAIIDLKLTKGTSGASISDFGAGAATVALPYTKNTDPAFLVKVYHIADDGTKTERTDAKFDPVTGKLTFTTKSFSTYMTAEEVGAAGQYTMTVNAADKHYNPGDTITANIVATTPIASNFGSFGFKLGYDAAKLTLVSLTTPLVGNTATNNGTLGCVISGTPTNVGTAGTIIATATFTVKTGIATGASLVTLTNPEMTYSGTSKCPTPTVVAKTVNLDNLKVTFAQGTGSTMASATAYAKHGVAGLWTTDSYATAFTFPTPVATDGYRLDTAKPWGKAELGYTAAEVKAMAFTADATFTARAVKTQKISFATSNGGTISNTTQQTIDKGANISTLTLPTATPATGYTFTGWHDGTNIINTDTYVVNADVTLTAKFAANEYTWAVAPAIAGATMDALTGVNAGKVTYGTDVTFTLTPTLSHLANYVVTAVSYTVGTGMPASLSLSETGTYTIPGTAILGDITLEVTTHLYHTVKFQAGTGTTLTPATLYAKHEVSGLYSDNKCTKSATVTDAVAMDGYRLKMYFEKPLWKDDTNTDANYQSIASKLFNSDRTYTAQAIKTYDVTFVAGANGTLSGAPIKITVDTGSVLKTTDIPTPTGNPGYVFDKWTPAISTTAAVEANATYTASFKDATYAISFSTTGATFTPTAGVTNGQVTHGTNVTFTMAEIAGYKVTAVNYQISGGAVQTLTAVGGVYTIPGANITGNVSVTAASEKLATVTFAAGANGTLTGNETKTVDKNYALQAGDIPTPVPTAGYKFVEWQIGNVKTTPEGYIVTADVTFTAVFANDSYAITKPDATAATVTYVSGNTGETATHGTDLVFTVAGVGNKIVNKVSYQIGSGAVTALTIGANGQFTIPGSAITAPITISVETLEGTIAFVGNNTYKAIAAGKQMVVFTTAKLTGTSTYSLGGTELYWSAKYNAYVCFAPVAETTATISAQLVKLTNKATLEISYTGDIEGTNPGVTPTDGLIINDILHNQSKETASDMRRFQLDVNGDKEVTTADIQVILNIYAGLVV